MRYQRHPTIDHYMRKVRLHSDIYEAEILGTSILIYPGVMSPKYDRSAQIFINMMPTQKSRAFLDMGSGTGIVSIFASHQGASTILAADINETAVTNTRANFQKFQLSDAVAIQSDLFENVSGKFDTIFFNAPFHGNRPLDLLERGVSDEDYATLEKFFENAAEHLTPGGKILLGFSDMSDNLRLKEILRINNYLIETLQTQENGDWTAYLYTISKKHE